LFLAEEKYYDDKTKLTLNVVIVIIIVGVVAATSIIGMGFVKSKLFISRRGAPRFR